MPDQTTSVPPFPSEPPASTASGRESLRSRTLTELHRIIQAGKIPNALLFTGAPGTGKKKAAVEFAKAANCMQGKGQACNACLSCKKIIAGMHPDMIAVGLEEKKKAISIAQIRELGQPLSARPNEARHRMVLIQDADQMNVQAQNALLKVLEEPPNRTFFILLATETATLLDTILSRCRRFRFIPATRAQIREILVRDHGVAPDTAHITVETLGTDLDRALACLNPLPDNGWDWFRFRQGLISQVLDLMSGPADARPFMALALAGRIASVPNRLGEATAVIRTVLRDLCIFRVAPEKIVNLDFFDAFKDISQVYGDTTFLRWLQDLHLFEKKLNANSSPRLSLDHLFLALSSAKGP